MQIYSNSLIQRTYNIQFGPDWFVATGTKSGSYDKIVVKYNAKPTTADGFAPSFVYERYFTSSSTPDVDFNMSLIHVAQDCGRDQVRKNFDQQKWLFPELGTLYGDNGVKIQRMTLKPDRTQTKNDPVLTLTIYFAEASTVFRGTKMDSNGFKYDFQVDNWYDNGCPSDPTNGIFRIRHQVWARKWRRMDLFPGFIFDKHGYFTWDPVIFTGTASDSEMVAQPLTAESDGKTLTFDDGLFDAVLVKAEMDRVMNKKEFLNLAKHVNFYFKAPIGTKTIFWDPTTGSSTDVSVTNNDYVVTEIDKRIENGETTTVESQKLTDQQETNLYGLLAYKQSNP